MLNINDIAVINEIYGPGERMVVWLQGCALHCPGCWNQQMWSFEKKIQMTPQELFQEVFRNKAIDGITLLGGEPLHQSSDLCILVNLVKAEKKTVILFTGFERDEIWDKDSKKLCLLADIVVYGRYVAQQRDTNLYLRGSKNQQIVFNSAAYDSSIIKDGRYCSIEFRKDGSLMYSGFPDDFVE